MNPLDFIIDELEHSIHYDPTNEDHLAVKSDGIENFIYKKLLSKKFRKLSIDDSVKLHTKIAIHKSVSRQVPLRVIYPFGGYKLWRIPTMPEADWSEFFAISYFIKYLAPIVKMYKPGVELVFSLDDVIMERLNNVSVKDTEKYHDSFKLLVGYFQKHFPDNFRVSIFRIGDLYDKTTMDLEINENLKDTRLYYKSLSSELYERSLKAAKLNIKWDGAMDLTKLSEAEKDIFAARSLEYHGAYCALSRRRESIRSDGNVIIFANKVPFAIPIGSTKNSIAKFWTGFGVLEASGKGLEGSIVPPSQMGAFTGNNLSKVTVGLFNIDNLKEIVILTKR